MKLRQTNDNYYLFYCEGCEITHGFNSTWQFNSDFDKPTISPSLLVRGTIPITDEECDLIMSGIHVEPKPFICHSFIKEGKIEYLNDCTHKLAGQTVELKDDEDWYKN